MFAILVSISPVLDYIHGPKTGIYYLHIYSLPNQEMAEVELQEAKRLIGEEAQAASRAAVARAERHIELHPEDARALYLGASALLQLDDRERCLAWAARALAIDPEENTTLYNVACIHAQLGRHDSALELLEKTVRNGFGNKEWMENDPDLSALKSDPRFETLLQLLAAKRTN